MMGSSHSTVRGKVYTRNAVLSNAEDSSYDLKYITARTSAQT